MMKFTYRRCWKLSVCLAIYVILVTVIVVREQMLSSSWRIPRQYSLVDQDVNCYSSHTAVEAYGYLCRDRFSVDSFLVKCRHLLVDLHCDFRESPCAEWTWDPANRTLIYLYENSSITSITHNDSIMCFVPRTPTKLVRKIVHPDSRIEYPGCNVTKTSCEWPFYDRHLRMRINTDPCCRSILINMTHHVTSLLDKFSVNHVIISGAVIGWIRDKSFVPYDHDIDIIVDSRDEDKFVKVVEEEFPKLGFIFEEANQGFFWIWNGKNKIIGPDVWYFYPVVNNSKAVTIKYGRKNEWVQPVSYLFPRQRGTLEGYQFWFPAKPVEYLDIEYGKGKWRNVLQCTEMSGKTCKA